MAAECAEAAEDAAVLGRQQAMRGILPVDPSGIGIEVVRQGMAERSAAALTMRDA